MLLEVTDIAKTFSMRQGWPVPRKVAVRALDGVSFGVEHGEALGVVGESGCGKSTAARVVLRLITADRGHVMFDGEDVLAADPARGRLAVLLNRASPPVPEGTVAVSRGGLVLDAVAGREPRPTTAVLGFNLVEVTRAGATVTMWDGTDLRRVGLTPGIHMIAHDDIDDEATARIAAWRDAFAEPAAADERWWEPWLDTLERTSGVGPTDDRAIVRDNRPFGYPTLSLLVCAASLGTDGVDVRYAEFDEPGQWNRPRLA